jgi:hypothetical protein
LARIIKNAFAPLFQEKFDLVAGNPPWVNWESLPQEYREETAYLWERYRLIPEDKANARQRSTRSKTDISLLMLAVAVDKYLVEKGKLGFVITQSIFKTERGGRGFRQNLIRNAFPMKVEYVDDLSEMQVFEGATNRTSVLVLRKGSVTQYPVSYSFWQKKEKGVSLSTNLSLTEALDLVKLSQWVARPIDPMDHSSPWITGRKRALVAISTVIGQSHYHSMCREGANTRGANGIFWVEKLSNVPDGNVLIANLPETGRLNISTVQAAIERGLLFPLLRGQDTSRWFARPDNWMIVPHDPSSPSSAVPIKRMMTTYPRTYQFLHHFITELSSRGKFRNFDPSRNEFYCLYNVGSYSFSSYKVVWREQSTELCCAVIGTADDLPIIPDHKLMTVPINNPEEAYYLCACLNSAPAKLIVRLYSIEIQISTHVLRYVNIPKFEPSNKIHKQLSDLSQQAHAAAAEKNAETVKEIETLIDEKARQLWDLTKEELHEIQESLAEFT